MVENIITLLIYICLLAILVYLVLWVLEQVGLAPPAKVVQLIWVIAVLVVILLFARMFLPALHMGRVDSGSTQWSSLTRTDAVNYSM